MRDSLAKLMKMLQDALKTGDTSDFSKTAVEAPGMSLKIMTWEFDEGPSKYNIST